MGGNSMIKMKELKQMFEAVGCERVQTYINSSKVMFESKTTIFDMLFFV